MKAQNNTLIIKKYFLITIAVFLLSFLLMCDVAESEPIFTIVPVNLSPLTVPSTNSVSLIYTVTNNAPVNFPAVTVNPNYNIPAGLLTATITNNTCGNSLPKYQQCTFEVTLQGNGIAGQTILMPEVGYPPAPHHCVDCSIPIPRYQIPVTVLSGAGSKVLQSISVTPATATVPAGGTQQFTATGYYSDGSNANISSSVRWTSSNTTIASVAAGGLATAIAAGSSTISATDPATSIDGTATLGVIGGLSTNEGVVSGGQTVTIDGAFGSDPSVTFDGNAATIVSASATQLVVTTPANSYAGGSGGKTVNVIITTSSGQVTLPNSYTYVGLNDPYEGGVIFYLIGPGNPGGSVVSTSDYGPNITWNQANAYCASYAGGGLSGWNLPNSYAYGATPTDAGAIMGEPGVLYNHGNPYAGMSPNNAYWGSNDSSDNNDGNHAWLENFGSGLHLSTLKTVSANYLYARCVRDFTG